jgi:hypothetical protein
MWAVSLMTRPPSQATIDKYFPPAAVPPVTSAQPVGAATP